MMKCQKWGKCTCLIFVNNPTGKETSKPSFRIMMISTYLATYRNTCIAKKKALTRKLFSVQAGMYSSCLSGTANANPILFQQVFPRKFLRGRSGRPGRGMRLREPGQMSGKVLRMSAARGWVTKKNRQRGWCLTRIWLWICQSLWYESCWWDWILVVRLKKYFWSLVQKNRNENMPKLFER